MTNSVKTCNKVTAMFNFHQIITYTYKVIINIIVDENLSILLKMSWSFSGAAHIPPMGFEKHLALRWRSAGYCMVSQSFLKFQPLIIHSRRHNLRGSHLNFLQRSITLWEIPQFSCESYPFKKVRSCSFMEYLPHGHVIHPSWVSSSIQSLLPFMGDIPSICMGDWAFMKDSNVPFWLCGRTQRVTSCYPKLLHGYQSSSTILMSAHANIYN